MDHLPLVISRRRALAGGLTDDQLAHRVRSGRLVTVLPGAQERLEDGGYVVVRVRWREAWSERTSMGTRVEAAFARGLRLH